MTVDESVDATIINESLQKVAKGAGLVFLGTVIGTILGFVERVLIARYYTQAQYGVFSLALVLLNIFAVIATLGLQEGVARQIAYYRGKEDDKKVRGIIISSIEIALIASIILSFILFFSSNFISTKIFHESLLSPVIKIFSITLPFFVLINIFVAIARGFNDVKPKVYFQSILRNIVFITFLILIILLGLAFTEVIYAFLLSFAISCLLLAIYITKRTCSIAKIRRPFVVPVKKELLLFSLPLLIFSILNMIMTWTDTLMLGYFKTSSVVGLYNAALPLARFIPTVLTSAGFLYVPIVSGLHARNLVKEVNRTYQVLTKWVFSLTLPIFFILFLFPETVLRATFGVNYSSASTVLRILSLGFIFHSFLGLNGLTLMVFGKTKFLVLTSSVAAVSNIILNITLIPKFSVEGAAIASLSAYCIANIINSTKLYRLYGVHPFTRNYLKPIGVSILLLTLIYYIASNFKIEIWALPVLLIIFLLSYFILLLITRSFDEEDMELFFTIERRMGVDFKIIKRILKKFT